MTIEKNNQKGNTPEGIYWRLSQIYQMCLNSNFPTKGCGNCVNGRVTIEYHTECLVNEKVKEEEWNPLYFCELWEQDMRVIAIIRNGE